MARSAREVHAPAGTVIITEGETGDTFYAVVDGRFAVTQAGTPLRSIDRGDGFGEIALLADVPRTATVTAATDGSLLAIDRDPFLLAVTGHEPAHDAAWERHRVLVRPRPHPPRERLIGDPAPPTAGGRRGQSDDAA